MAFVQIKSTGGRKYVYVKESVWDSKKQAPKSVLLENHGRLDECLKKDPEYIEKLKDRIASQTKADKSNRISLPEESIQEFDLEKDFKYDLNVGAALIKKIWQRFKLDILLNSIQRSSDEGARYPYNKVAFLLCSQRILNPSSKIKTFENRNSQIIDLSEVNDSNMLYRALGLLARYKDRIVYQMNKAIDQELERNMTVALYDVTTYWFESRDEDLLRTFGMSKDGKPGEVQIVLGLLIDDNGIPVDYDLFPGNTSEFKTMIPIIKSFISKYKIDKLTIVADRGLNSNENLKELNQLGLKFVIAQKVKNCNGDIKSKILSEENWDRIHTNDDGEVLLKYKTLHIKRPIFKTKISKKTGKAYSSSEQIDELDVRWVVTYSSKRSKKDNSEIDRAEQKALDAINKGTVNIRGHGFKGFIKFGRTNEKPVLDEAKLAAARQWAGYYAICTNVEDLTDQKVVEIYHQLWRIEDCFRVTKSNLETRPCFVWTKESIEGHFLTCYVALVMQKYLQTKLRNTLPPEETTTEKVLAALREAVLAPLPENNKNGQQYFYRRYAPSSLFDKMCPVFGIEPLSLFETATAVRSKLQIREINLGS